MTEKARIAELEAKLAALQVEDNGGKDPELLAKAKDRARMSWMDIKFVLELMGAEEMYGPEDIKMMQDKLVDHKYAQLSGQNRTALSWGA